MKAFAVVLSLLIALSFDTAPCRAETAWITAGGDPHILSESRTIEMESEVVDIVISKERVRFDCRYVFVNKGPACKVRMGLPAEVSEVDDENPAREPFGTFLTYDAYVEGNPVPVQKIREIMERTLWHTSDIEFAENQSKTFRNSYTTCPKLSGEAPDDRCFVVAYNLSSANSWHGKIGSALVNITFENDVLPSLPELVAEASLQKENAWKRSPAGAVYCHAPANPDLHGRTVTVKLTDTNRKQEDDIMVAYGHITEKEGDAFLEQVRKKLLREAISKQSAAEIQKEPVSDAAH